MTTDYKLCCETCDKDARDHPIAIFSLSDISFPILGSMFRSPDPEHGLIAPWHDSITWQWMKCPYCDQIPFAMYFDTLDDAETLYFPTRFLTTEGYIPLQDPGDHGQPETGTSSIIRMESDDVSGLSPGSVDKNASGLSPGNVDDAQTSGEELEPIQAKNPVDETPPDIEPYDPKTGECPYCRKKISKRPGHLKRHMIYYCKSVSPEEVEALKSLEQGKAKSVTIE